MKERMPIDTDRKREHMFWNTCLPARGVFALTATAAEVYDVRFLALAMATYLGLWGVFMLRNFVRGRTAPSLRERSAQAKGAEKAALEKQLYEIEHGNFGGRVWWQPHRAVHGTLLVVYAALTYASVPYAFVAALIDVGYAIVVGVLYYRVGLTSCRLA